MSEKQAKRHRRQQRRLTHPLSPQSSSSGGAHGPGGPQPPSSPVPPSPDPLASSLLSISLSAAVPLRIVGCYERGGPTDEDFERARAFGRVLAERGDRLLFPSEKSGETADLFNQLAEALAILSFVPGGVPRFFGQRFEAESVLAGFIGREEASAYCQQVRAREDSIPPESHIATTNDDPQIDHNA